ncbi:MAG: PAS domain-containing sensor histidine kinase [Saprospiraceae bacterium]|nr:PAS domain-containing sensor histidine kinase [Saprospiraceae bacterium]
MSKDTLDPFQEIFNAAVEGVIVSNKAGKIILSNPSAASMFGYERDELMSLTIEDLLPAGNKPQHKKLRRSYFDKPASRQMGVGMDLRAMRKDGSIFPVEISLSNTIIGNETVVVSYIIDITERKKIEYEIKREKETAQMYLDIAGAVFMVLDKNGKLILINQAGSRLLGLPEKDIIGKDWFDNFTPEDRRDKVRTIFKRILKKKTPSRSLDEYIINSKGERRIVSWHIALILDENGKPASLIGSGVDVTDQKSAEAALKRSQEKLIIYATELEKKVSERTKELAEAINNLEKINAELQDEVGTRIRAEKDARIALEKEKELNELKSRFVSLASHEFRTPLSTISSSASLIARYDNAETLEKRQKHIVRIKNNVNNLTGLLNDFLNLEKVEEGKIVATYEKIDFVELVNEAVEEMQANSKAGQVIELESDSSVTGIYLDKQMLKNIFLNLLSNAIKYSPPESIIKFKYFSSKDNLQIEVADQGIGISTPEQSHLFTRFFRAKNASGIQGTGLGLYLVKKYVEEMQGSITFTSELEQGTTFTIQFPLNNG